MSSRIFQRDFTRRASRHMLDAMPKEKLKTLSVKMPLELLAEFHVAVDILRLRTSSDAVHNFARETVKEAKHQVSDKEFRARAEAEMRGILKRSKTKALERKRSEERKSQSNDAERSAA